MPRPKLPGGHTIHTDHRPINLARVIDHDANGNPITSAERFNQIVAMGESLHVAAACAAISLDTATDHIKAGALIAHDLARGTRTETLLPPKDQVKLAFHRGFTEAYARGMAFHAGLRAQVMRGGGTITTRTTTTRSIPNPDGGEPVVETTQVVKTEQIAPDPATIRWFAERRWPEHFGARLTITGEPAVDPMDIPEPDRIAAMIEAAEAYLADQSDTSGDVIETTATVVPTMSPHASDTTDPRRNGG